MKTKSITTAAAVAAAYVALCLVFQPISYGGVQVRIAEAMTVLPVFVPAAIPGLFIGCMIANLIGGGIVLDVIFGSLATLIGALGTYFLRNKPIWLTTLPPIVSNTVVVPLVLKYGYGIEMPLVILALTICAGEIIGCGILGTLLGTGLRRRIAGDPSIIKPFI